MLKILSPSMNSPDCRVRQPQQIKDHQCEVITQGHVSIQSGFLHFKLTLLETNPPPIKAHENYSFWSSCEVERLRKMLNKLYWS